MGANWICSRRGIASRSRCIRRTATPNVGLSKKYAPHAMGIGINRVVAAGLSPPPSSGRRTPKNFLSPGPACAYAPFTVFSDPSTGRSTLNMSRGRASRTTRRGGNTSYKTSASNATNRPLIGSWGRSSTSSIVRWWMRVKYRSSFITTR